MKTLDRVTHNRSIHFVSLGCPKNRVDSEVMLGVAESTGYCHVDDPAQAEVIVINTCGFIEAAKKESIETILELSRHKQGGACKSLVVSGCLSQRYPEELASELPEVDHFLGSSDMLKLKPILQGSAERNLVGDPAQWVLRATDPRRVSTRGSSAYVKIAEGCNRNCAFCVIPQIRGKQRSRRVSDVVLEVERLASRGVLEVNLVSQDTVAYGRDLSQGRGLSHLVEQVAEVPGIRWVRLFYLYPEALDDRLLDLLAEHPRVLPYVDMPLQHASDRMLRRMGRGHGGARLRRVVERLRERVPGLTFRTAFIVGHPGETEEEFRQLREFVEWAEFDRVGVFRYSDEETARSYRLSNKVSPRTAAYRETKLLVTQRAISRRKNRALLGQTLEVLVEGPSEESELVMVGRHGGQAPEIDGAVYLSEGFAAPGTMVQARVAQATDYDLLAEVVDPAPLYQRSMDGKNLFLRTIG